ncbi:MAG: PBSX family phage terminase large subunit [Clostridiales bacterium]|nr:PBSX family phage terminase large subunit [Clostridiales bacterium]
MAFEWGTFSRKAVQSILESDARINIWDGAVRSSKTVSSIAAFLVFAAQAPPGALLMAGVSERSLRRNILDLLVEMVGQKNFQLYASRGEAALFGRTVYLTGAGDERAEERIRGLTLAGAYGDELTVWPQSFFRMLLSRLSIRGARFFGTTNPDSAYHWLMTDYLAKGGLNLRRWHFTLDDNPNLPLEYRRAVEAEYTGLWRRRFIEGEWCAAEGRVYEMFDPQCHVCEEDVSKYPRRIAACDYGIRNPCVFGLVSADGKKRYYLEDEWYHDGRRDGQKTDNEYADAFDRFLKGRQIEYLTIDPSASSLIVLMKQRGVRVIPARNNVLEGIRTVSKLLSQGDLKIAPRCRETLREFDQYRWMPDEQCDAPVKEHDHCMDMLRYAVYTDAFSALTDRKSFSGKGAH